MGAASPWVVVYVEYRLGSAHAARRRVIGSLRCCQESVTKTPVKRVASRFPQDPANDTRSTASGTTGCRSLGHAGNTRIAAFVRRRELSRTVNGHGEPAR